LVPWFDLFISICSFFLFWFVLFLVYFVIIWCSIQLLRGNTTTL
jgi:hypothetical protein